MTVDFDLKEEDYVAFNEYYFYKTNGGAKLLWMRVLFSVLIALAILGIDLLLTRFFGGAMQWTFALVVCGVALLAFNLIFNRVLSRELKKIIKKEVQKKDNGNLLGKRHLTINGPQLQISDGTASASYDLREIYRIVTYEEVVLIFTNPMATEIIPLRDLSEKQQTALQTALNPYLKS